MQQYLTGFSPFIALGFIFKINYVVAIGLMVTMPVVPLFMIIMGKGAASLHQKYFVSLERLGSLFVDRLSSLRLLAVFKAHKHQQQILESSSTA